MGQKVRSMRGELVDLDLLQMKQQIANTPKPATTQEREKFVDKKIRRRVKKQKTQTSELDIDPEVEEIMADETPVVAEEVVDTPAPKAPRKRRGA